MNKTPDTTHVQEDMSFVELAEGNLGKQPVNSLETNQQQDERFAVAATSKPQPSDIAKASEIEARLVAATTESSNKLINQEEIVAKHKENRKTFESLVATHNKERGSLKKVFGMGKISSTELMKKIESNNFDSAYRSLDAICKKMEDDEKSLFYKAFKKMISNHVALVVESGDNSSMLSLVNNNRLDDIGVENIAKMPQQVIQDKVAQEKLSLGIQRYFKPHYLDPEKGVQTVQEYIKLNLMTKEKTQEVIESEEVQSILRGSIEKCFKPHYLDPEKGVQTVQEYIKLNLMTKEKTQEVIESEEVQSILRGSIQKYFKKHYTDEQKGREQADQLVGFGLMNRKQADQVVQDAITNKTT